MCIGFAPADVWPGRNDAQAVATIERNSGRGEISRQASTSGFRRRQKLAAQNQRGDAVEGEESIQGFQIQDGKAGRSSRASDAFARRHTAGFGPTLISMKSVRVAATETGRAGKTGGVKLNLK